MKLPSREDEQLVADLKAGLARLAGSGRGASDGTAAARQAAIDGAEFVARSDILIGQRRLPQLLPSFAFLVALPGSGKAEALRISARAARLLEEAAEIDARAAGSQPEWA